MMQTNVDLDTLTKSARSDGRVDVIKLANNLGIDVFSEIMKKGNSGNIQYKDNKFIIKVNQLHPSTRQRFTIAHELAHYLKHPQIVRKKGQLYSAGAPGETDEDIKIESEADKIASEILMPEYLVKEMFNQKKWTQNTNFDSKKIDEIARKFFVSREMAVYRLRDLCFRVPYIAFA